MRKIKIKQRLKIRGEYSYGGNVYPNVITDVGLTEMAKVLIGHGLPPLYVEGGYGTAAPLTIDVDLDSPVPYADITFKDTDSSKQPFEYPRKKADIFRIIDHGSPPVPIPDNQLVLRYSTLIGGEEGDTTGFPGVFEEVGVFNLPYRPTTRGGVMYSRALALPAIQTRNNLGGRLDWTLTVDKGDVSSNGGITTSGLGLLANVMMRRKDASASLSQPNPTNTTRQYEDKYADLFINDISVGRGISPTSEGMRHLEDKIHEGNIADSNRIGRVTSVNITPASTSGGFEFPAKIQIQRAIRAGDVNEEVSEVGLSNISYSQGLLSALGFTRAGDEQFWGRHVLAIPLPAGEEAVIQFDIEIGR